MQYHEQNASINGTARPAASKEPRSGDQVRRRLAREIARSTFRGPDHKSK